MSTVAARVFVINPIDVSALLGPGVYILKRRGKVVFTGRADVSMLAWVHAHATNTRTEYFPPMAKPVRFDEIQVYPCAKGEVEATWAKVYAQNFGPAIAEAIIAPLRRRA